MFLEYSWLIKKAVLIYLKERSFVEEFSQNAAAGPDVDGGAIPLLAQQQLRRSVPQRNHLIRVRTLLIVRLKK
jgi:hypothetical protein